MRAARLAAFLALASCGGAAGLRRALKAEDVAYGLEAWVARFSTSAPALFAAESHFHDSLLSHEASLTYSQLQSFVATLHDSAAASETLSASLERRANLTLHTALSGDSFLLHGTRQHADSLREQPEVRAVVALLPQLKVTPHFEKLLPDETPDAKTTKPRPISLIVRLVPLERHAHLRRPAKQLADVYTQALSKACEADKEWAAMRACGAEGGATIRYESERTLVVQNLFKDDASKVAHLVATQGETLWVEPSPTYRTLNADAVAITQSGSAVSAAGVYTPVGTYPIHAMGLHGEGEVIGVGDSGLDMGHCFFEDAPGGTAAAQTPGPAHRKVVNYRPYADGEATGLRDHGTHVVGSILGESSTPGAAGSTERGSAYKAKVSFTDIGPGDAPGLAVPEDLVANFFNVDYEQGARIHSNSWGANINEYTIPTSDVDEFMHTFDDMLILFAAGNSGQEGPGSIGAPATCKNCLTVGASENNEPPNRADGNVAVFSSQGPAVGQRIKPDLVSPGFSVNSANSNSPGDCPITSMAGTSMATPITAGDVALIRQYFREGFFPGGTPGGAPKIPSGALMKAMAVHSAVPITGTYQGAPFTPPPSNVQGFGRTQLNRVLFGYPAPGQEPTPGQPGADAGGAAGRRLQDAPAPGDPATPPGPNPGDRLFFVDDASRTLATGQEHTFNIPISPTPDPILGTAFKVTLVWTDPPAQPLAQTPLVNNLDLKVNIGGTDYIGNGALDTANTVEQVEVPTATGSATITVRGTAVTQGPQKYALVVTGSLMITSPPPAAPAPPPPSPPRTPFSGDAVAIGITIPLLILAVGAGGCFLCRRKAGVKGSSTGGGGGAASGLLPPGWRQLRDPTSGAPYYLNEADGQTSWEPPAMPKPPLPPGAPPGSAVPVPWTEVIDPGTKRTYYYNSVTGATQWTMPN